MAIVSFGNTAFRSLPRIPAVDANIPSSSSSSSSEPVAEDVGDARRFFPLPFFAVVAQAGAGLIFSYWRRRRRSYSRPPSVSSSGASRSFLKRLSVASETFSVASSGSIHAGALRECGFLEVEGNESASASYSSVAALSSGSSTLDESSISGMFGVEGSPPSM